jgi:seryl-tRNA synthetase
MLDINLIRKDKTEIEALIKRKDPNADLSKVLQLDQHLREIKTKTEQLKSSRNLLSKKIGEHKREGLDVTDLMQEADSFSDEIHALDHELAILEKEFNHELAGFPNIPMKDIFVSQNPADNVKIKEWGQKPVFHFPFKNHLELNEKLHLFDFVRGAKITGTGWPVYCGMGARLEWALINYMVETHIKNGFTQWMPPALVRPEILYGAGMLPKFDNQQFKIQDQDFNLYLIPTAEISLNGLHSEEIFQEEDLPLKYMAYTPCFRREAGAAGGKERGLIRMHQFNKVEMFCFTKPEDSSAMFEAMVASAEAIMQGLELHYRSMLLCTGDMSYCAARTVDVEAWLPGQDRYYEVSSISNCTDYQSRRSNIRFKRKETKKNELVHTLNGSGLATSRLMVALVENNQNPDGSINVPKVLQPYLGGIAKIEES